MFKVFSKGLFLEVLSLTRSRLTRWVVTLRRKMQFYGFKDVSVCVCVCASVLTKINTRISQDARFRVRLRLKRWRSDTNPFFNGYQLFCFGTIHKLRINCQSVKLFYNNNDSITWLRSDPQYKTMCECAYKMSK